MSILDALLLIVLGLGLFRGFKRGVIREGVSLIGFILAFILAFSYKNVIAAFMYERLPFFSFDWLFNGISSINIIVYEMIAFFLILGVLLVILKIIGMLTGIIEKILTATVILGIPSKILGGILGLVEAWVLIFVFTYFATQPFFDFPLLDNSNIASAALEKTPIVSGIAESYVDAFEEIYSLKSRFGEEENDEINNDVIDVLLKYNITKVESIDILIEKNKINSEGMDEILNKYRTEEE